MSLEEQFRESERQRLEAESLKNKKKAGLPINESQKLLGLLENTEIGAQYSHLTGVIDIEKLTAENTQQLDAQTRQIQEQANEISALKSEITLMRSEIAVHNQKLDDFLQREGRNPELTREALQKLIQYLEDWV